MKGKLGLLGSLLILRMVVGGLVSQRCVYGQQIRVAGIVNEVYQKETKSILVISDFLIETEESDEIFRGQKVAIVGRCDRRVIDFLLSKNRLVNSKITDVDETNDAKNRLWVSGGLLRDKLVRIYQKYLPEPEASLAAGIVLGAKGNLPDKFYDALINTGTIHIVVASGYNLTIISEILFYTLIYFVSRKKATIGVIFGMIFYAWLNGWSIPVVRALLMASLILFSKLIGRAMNVEWWLALAVWVMLMFKPDLIINISFQLSAAATAGLALMEPRLRLLLKSKHKSLDVLAKTELIPTLSAQIATAPIIWWHFGRLSLISPLVNLLVLPLVPIVMILGVAGLFLGWLVVPLLYSLLHLMIVIIYFFGG